MVRFRSSSLALSAWCIVASASAGGWDDALARIPADAASVVAIPNIKAASDDLQQAIDRLLNFGDGSGRGDGSGDGSGSGGGGEGGE